MIRVLLVDDHHLIRSGIKQLLESSQQIRVVIEADCGEDALTKLEQQTVDLAVVDIQMPGMSAQELIQRLFQRTPSIRSVVLTSLNEESFMAELLINGAYSFVTKSCDSEHLIKAIEKTMQNERHLSPDVAKRLAYRILNGLTETKKQDSPFQRLSSREMQCLELLIEGKTIKEIAELLKINAKTINTYRYRIFQKLKITNDIDLIKVVKRYHLFESEQSDFS